MRHSQPLGFRLFEFEDMKWFPQVIRQGMMDYLGHLITWSSFYQPCAEIIQWVLIKSQTNAVMELCAGSGGGTVRMLAYLDRLDCHPSLMLSDLYPQSGSWKKLNEKYPAIKFAADPVNALDVPENFTGLRLMFSALHHFPPQKVQALMLDAMRKKSPVAFFDAGTTNPLYLLLVWLIEPLTFALLTPFFKPFSWTRIVFTYFIPLIVLCTLWDGSISVLRFYSKKQLVQFAAHYSSGDYGWQAGQLKNRLGFPVNYLAGIPLQEKE
jgi:hypothetical protein